MSCILLDVLALQQVLVSDFIFSLEELGYMCYYVYVSVSLPFRECFVNRILMKRWGAYASQFYL